MAITTSGIPNLFNQVSLIRRKTSQDAIKEGRGRRKQGLILIRAPLAAYGWGKWRLPVFRQDGSVATVKINMLSCWLDH